MATKFKIHPAIGIARVGDSTTGFYLAPESAGALPIACDQNGNTTIGSDGTEAVVSSFKDGNGAVLRQGARFRVYAYDDATPGGREIKVGDQLEFLNSKTGQKITGAVSDIVWTVYVANKKSNWYEFQQLEGEHGYSPDHPLRNANITDAGERQALITDPGPQKVNSKNRTAQFAQGQNKGYAQSFPPPLNPFSITTLGGLMATQQVTEQGTYNRLVVLGGYGNSGSMLSGFGQPSIQTYANNDGWFDDISDGPVMAQVAYNVLQKDPNDPNKWVPTGQTGTATVDVAAWVIVGYPRYAPQITDIITMDDLIYDLAIRNQAYNINIYGVPPFDGSQTPPDRSDPSAMHIWRANAKYNPDYYPYFWRDIWPILSRPNQYTWVLDFEAWQGGDPHNTGPGGNLDQQALSIPPFNGENPDERQYRRAQRQFIYNILRKPGQENRLTVPSNPRNPKNLPHAMPLLCGDNPISNDIPSKFLRLTDTMLFILRQWAEGKFINEQIEDIPDPAEPPGVALDRGVLANMMGGSFCPGAEATWIMRNPAIYSEPYRIHSLLQINPVTGKPNYDAVTPGSLSQPSVVAGADSTYDMAAGMGPGDITKYSGVPWQSDFNECSTQNIDITYEQWNQIYPGSEGDPIIPDTYSVYWWPSHRPMGVYQQLPTPPGQPLNYTQMDWAQGIPQSNYGDLKMVTAWKYLGFLINNSEATQVNGYPAYVQIERDTDDI
jgi:hypothetical protein